MRLFELLYLMVRLPVAAFVYGVEAFGRVLGDVQEIAGGGYGLLAAEAHDVIEAEILWSDEAPVSDLGAWGEPLPLLPETSSFVTYDVPKEPTKEDRKVDQDLSGDMVKVVQYTIVSVATGPGGQAFVLSTEYGTDVRGRSPDPSIAKEPPLREVNVIAFSDDMTGEDFTSWMMSIHSEDINRALKNIPALAEALLVGVRARKYLRVAYSVIGRFAPADIDYTELQAAATVQLAKEFNSTVQKNTPKKGEGTIRMETITPIVGPKKE